MAYWDHVTRLVETTMDTRTDIGNAAKADLLRDELAKINTTDEFYVIVYNDCTGWDKHAFHYKTAKTLVRFRRGMCNVVVYASSTAHTTKPRIYDELKNKVQANWYNCQSGSMRERVAELYNKIDNCEFVGLVRSCHNPEIRSTGNWEWGPGWWLTGTPDPLHELFRGSKKTVIIAGLP